MTYEYYASDPTTVTVGSGGWAQPSTAIKHVDLWAPSFDSSPVHWGEPIIRKPKEAKWEPYFRDPKDYTVKRIEEIDNIGAVSVHTEIRPVMVCGWCGARIPRGKETEECEYCGS